MITSVASDGLQAALGHLGQIQPADEREALVVSKCRALIAGYHIRWGAPDFTILGVETQSESDLFNPETKARSRTFRVVGKIDLLVNRNSRKTLFDHKTTSEDIKDPNSPYWRQLIIEAQPSHYMLLEWLNGRKVDEAVWNVLKKPDIRPKQVAKKEREEVKRYRHYFGGEVSEESIEAMLSTERETLEMYEMRLAHDCTTERPEHYFQRRTIPRLDSDIHEHAEELWSYGQELILARRLDRHGRNSGACMVWGRPCTYLGICSHHDEPTSSNWRVKEQVHNELALDGDGRDVLTNSRLTAFKTCRRKEYYQYEMGIERVEEDEAESLFFGSTWHSTLQRYYEFYQSEQNKGDSNGKSNIGSSGIELDTVAIENQI